MIQGESQGGGEIESNGGGIKSRERKRGCINGQAYR